MPLPIRDGNQSLATLSTLIVNSAHVPAHTVISLGSQAITDIAQAVSGVELGPNTINALENISVTFGVGTSITIGNVVSVTGGLTNTELRASSVTIGGSVQVSNFPATQTTTFGAVTGSVSVLNFPATQSVTFGTSVVTGSVSVLNLPATQTVTFTQASVTFSQAVVSASNINGLNSSVATEGVLDGALNFVKIGGHQDGSNQTAHIVHVSAGGAMKVDGSGSTQPVSISSVTVGNFPATQTVTFTQASVTFSSITGSVSVLNLPATQAVTFGAISGSVTATISGTPSVTFSAITGSTSILNFPSTQTVAGTVTANLAGQNSSTFLPDIILTNGAGSIKASLTNDSITQICNDDGNAFNALNPLPISGTVTANVGIGSKIMILDSNGEDIVTNPLNGALEVNVKNSVTIGSLPAISGTVTANLSSTNLNTVTIGIRGTVTASGLVNATGADNVTQVLGFPIVFNDAIAEEPEFKQINVSNPLPVRAYLTTVTVGNSVTIGSLPVQLSTTTIGGTARLNVTLSSATTVGGTAPSYANLYGGSDGTNLRAISVDTSGRTVVTGSVSIASTTVTVSALPSGALTTRFGSVTTANTAQITSAVTNTSRKYLLAQNISAGTVTIGIGFSPTTTQGIQLTAGGGLTFDAFCPTGAVYWLGAVTGAAFTILEG